MSEDTILELIDLLEYALEERDWNSVEEALSIVKVDNDRSELDDQV